GPPRRGATPQGGTRGGQGAQPAAPGRTPQRRQVARGNAVSSGGEPPELLEALALGPAHAARQGAVVGNTRIARRPGERFLEAGQRERGIGPRRGAHAEAQARG